MVAPLVGAVVGAGIAPKDSIALALFRGATAATLIATGAAALAGYMRHQLQEGPAADGR